MKTEIKGSAAAAAVALMFLTGCGPADPATPPAAAPSAGAAGTKGDCEAVVGSFRTLLAGLLQNMIPSEGPEGADPNATTRKALTDYATAARAQATGVADPTLRGALEQHATAAEKLSKAADPTDLEDPGFADGSARIEKACADALTPTASPGTATVRLGGKDSACTLPVSFDLPPLWKPKAVDLAELGELADLYRNGPFEAVCEIDAKPAGEVGFLRVHMAADRTGSPRSHLEAFLAGESVDARKAGNFEVRKTEYRNLTVGGRPAAEVTYEVYNEAMDHESKYSAFALNTSKGAVVVRLSPFGADEHANVLPVFELAKKTLTVNR